MLQQLYKSNKAHDRQYECIYNKLVKLPALKLLKEIYSDRGSEEVIRQQEDHCYQVIDEIRMGEQCIDQIQDIRRTPHENTKGEEH